jgi:hypothetical protein
MKLFTSKPAPRKTAFAAFISGASSREKKQVYKVVLEKSAESQKRVVAAAKVATTP